MAAHERVLIGDEPGQPGWRIAHKGASAVRLGVALSAGRIHDLLLGLEVIPAHNSQGRCIW